MKKKIIMLRQEDQSNIRPTDLSIFFFPLPMCVEGQSVILHITPSTYIIEPQPTILVFHSNDHIIKKSTMI